LTVTAGKLNVAVAVIVGVGVIEGVNVLVGMVVAVDVNITVGIGVSVAGTTVNVSGAAVEVACCPGAGEQALVSNRPSKIIFNLISILLPLVS